MPSTRELFGEKEGGTPLIELHSHGPEEAKVDVSLPVCYRNTPWALTLAHALGLGIYRHDGLVQYFDNPESWEDAGYKVVSGAFEPGSRVTLERHEQSYPEYFERFLQRDDAVSHHAFLDEFAQADWLAGAVEANLSTDELEADDILVILPNAYTAKSAYNTVMRALEKRGIDSHLAGVTTSRDTIFSKDSVAVANVYRSKGNEASMVYILNSQHCFAGYELLRLRNTLFTAITRSRAWVRVCGWGEEMGGLIAEINQAAQNDYRLTFTVPSPEELQKMKRVHRERTREEVSRIRTDVEGVRDLIELLRSGELSLEALPADVRAGMATFFPTKRVI